MAVFQVRVTITIPLRIIRGTQVLAHTRRSTRLEVITSPSEAVTWKNDIRGPEPIKDHSGNYAEWKRIPTKLIFVNFAIWKLHLEVL